MEGGLEGRMDGVTAAAITDAVAAAVAVVSSAALDVAAAVHVPVPVSVAIAVTAPVVFAAVDCFTSSSVPFLLNPNLNSERV